MSLCGRRSSRTRARSPRQLPTDHDYAVPTREYQSDQPSQNSRLGHHRCCVPSISKDEDEGKKERIDEQCPGVTNKLV